MNRILIVVYCLCFSVMGFFTGRMFYYKPDLQPTPPTQIVLTQNQRGEEMERINFTKVQTEYDVEKDKFSRRETKNGISIPSDLLAKAIIETHPDYKGTGLYYSIKYFDPIGSRWTHFDVKESPLELLEGKKKKGVPDEE